MLIASKPEASRSLTRVAGCDFWWSETKHCRCRCGYFVGTKTVHAPLVYFYDTAQLLCPYCHNVQHLARKHPDTWLARSVRQHLQLCNNESSLGCKQVDTVDVANYDTHFVAELTGKPLVSMQIMAVLRYARLWLRMATRSCKEKPVLRVVKERRELSSGQTRGRAVVAVRAGSSAIRK